MILQIFYVFQKQIMCTKYVILLCKRQTYSLGQPQIALYTHKKCRLVVGPYFRVCTHALAF